MEAHLHAVEETALLEVADEVRGIHRHNQRHDPLIVSNFNTVIGEDASRILGEVLWAQFEDMKGSGV